MIYTGWPGEKVKWFSHFITNDPQHTHPRDAHRMAIHSNTHGWMLFVRGEYPTVIAYGVTDDEAALFVERGKLGKIRTVNDA